MLGTFFAFFGFWCLTCMVRMCYHATYKIDGSNEGYFHSYKCYQILVKCGFYFESYDETVDWKKKYFALPRLWK